METAAETRTGDVYLTMSRRTEKVASTIRQVLSQSIATKLSDPRISEWVSVTRVEVSGDLMNASVYVSVMGGEGEQSKCMAGLQHARGYLQSLLAKSLTTRHCPQLRFVLDQGIEKQMKTLELIEQISEELRQSEQTEASSGDDANPERPAERTVAPDGGASEQVPPGESR